MAILPTRKEISKFFDHHPFLSVAFTVAGAFTLYETINAIKAPRGQGPFSGMGHLSKKQQTTLDAVEKELYGASKMHKSQAQRISKLGHLSQEQRATLDTVEKELYGASKMHRSQAQRISQLGASTSTTSSTSSSHAMMDRPLTQDIVPVRNVGHSDFFGINPHLLGASNLGSANLPPAMRRRVSQRQRGTGPIGSFGNVALDYEDNVAMSNYDAVGNLYGLGGMSPEGGAGWTE